MKRKQYCALFDVRIKTDPYTGRDRREAVYIGSYYMLALSSNQKKRLSVSLLALWVICLGLFVLCGLTNANSSRCFYVLPFYILLLLPICYLGMAVSRLARMKDRFTKVDVDEGIDRVGRCAMGLMILAALHTVAEVVFLCLGGAEDKLTNELCTMFGVAAIGVLGFAAYRVTKALEPQPELQAQANPMRQQNR